MDDWGGSDISVEDLLLTESSPGWADVGATIAAAAATPTGINNDIGRSNAAWTGAPAGINSDIGRSIDSIGPVTIPAPGNGAGFLETLSKVVNASLASGLTAFTTNAWSGRKQSTPGTTPVAATAKSIAGTQGINWSLLLIVGLLLFIFFRK